MSQKKPKPFYVTQKWYDFCARLHLIGYRLGMEDAAEILKKMDDGAERIKEYAEDEHWCQFRFNLLYENVIKKNNIVIRDNK
jgi:hypothetical protein